MSAVLSDGQLSTMRTLYESSLWRTCDVERGVLETPDGQGGFTQSPNTVLEDIPCSFMATAGREVFMAGELAAIGNFILSFPYDVVLGATDLIRVLATSSEAARSFKLVGVLDEATAIGQRWLATEEK